jgi:RNA polymerase sigma-70 factor (ECF subfamily)
VPETILQRVAAGDASAVEDCLSQYGGLVWSIARRFISEHADAEDAVQDVFIDIWRNASRYDPEIGSEATFVTMIARRRLIDRQRRQARRISAGPIEEQTISTAAEHERQVEMAEEAARVREQMETLRPAERRVLELSISYGLSQSEIAERTRLPLGTVKTHSRRGLIRLRNLLGTEPLINAGEAGHGETVGR